MIFRFFYDFSWYSIRQSDIASWKRPHSVWQIFPANETSSSNQWIFAYVCKCSCGFVWFSCIFLGLSQRSPCLNDQRLPFVFGFVPNVGQGTASARTVSWRQCGHLPRVTGRWKRRGHRLPLNCFTPVRKYTIWYDITHIAATWDMWD